MANLTDLKNLLSKALSDPAFRSRLLKSPVQTAAKFGVKLTPGQSSAIKKLHRGIKKQADRLMRLAADVRGSMVISPRVVPRPPRKKPRKPRPPRGPK